MLGRDEQMQPGFVDFKNFAQAFGFVTACTLREDQPLRLLLNLLFL